MDWLKGFTVFFVESEGSEPNNFIYHYQGLLGGALAFIAAILSIAYLWRQQKQDQERRYRSQKANLSFALSDLHDYANQCIQSLAEIMRGRGEDEDIRAEFEPPAPPQYALTLISQLIELCSEEDAHFLTALLQHCQIQHARLRAKAERLSPQRSSSWIMLSSNLHHDVVDAFILKNMADHLFAFARGRADHIGAFNADENQISGSLTYMDLFDRPTRDYVQELVLDLTEAAFSKSN